MSRRARVYRRARQDFRAAARPDAGFIFSGNRREREPCRFARFGVDPKTRFEGKGQGANQEDSIDSVYVEGKRWLFNRRTRYAHSLPEVDGPTITVTKKTSVVQLNDVPTLIDNNQRELFDRLPGIVLAEQQNPTELNLSYRGLAIRRKASTSC